ncbi:MAG: iron ABC transporter permease [Spirochaetota bacterium]
MNKRILIFVFLFCLLIFVSLLSLFTGSSEMSIHQILSAVREGKGSSDYSIIFDIRLPRILMGFAVGGSLSLAGAILQGMFRNPLVEPYTLGLSGGSLLGVCLGILFGINRIFGIISLPLCGFAGAFVIILLIYFLSMKKGIIQINGLLLTGVMISYISSSALMLIMAIAKTEDLRGIVFWMMGSLEESNWSLIKLALSVSVAGLLASYYFCLSLNALSLGEEEAMHLGVNVERVKRILFVVASVLTGVCVSVAGLIGFVGLIVPHLLRMLTGGDHRLLLAGSFLFGASFLIFCDMLARSIAAPMELPVGVITGIVGGGFFVYAMSRRSRRWKI